MYDIYDKGVLDIYTLREVLKRSYSGIIIQLQNGLKKLRETPTEVEGAWTWQEFE